MKPKLVCFVGYHNSGKTTLIEGVVRKLSSMGYRVGYLKHDPMGHGITDKENSDTNRLFRLVDKVGLVSPEKLTLWERREDNPLNVVADYFRNFDLVILEGWKSLHGVKKVVVGNLNTEGLKVDEKTPLEYIISYILED